MARTRDLSALMTTKQPAQTKPKAGKTKTTIVFDGDDETEIRRIEDVLRAKGVRVTEVTKIVRLALRVAFSDKTDTEVQALCAEMAERWKRGG